MSSGGWFPRPSSEADVYVVTPGPGRTPRGACDLLLDGSAVEWRDKVGVAGRADGSAKTSTRLLGVRGWVAKTNVDAASRSRDELEARLRAALARGGRAGLWHPAKYWLLVRSAGSWYPVTLCPEMRTLRSIERLDARLEAWLAMIRLGIRSWVDHRVGLDLNPANFGFAEAEGGRRPSLHYLDDETTDWFGPREIATAAASRIPEEPGCGEETWRRWGEALSAILAGDGSAGFDPRAAADEVSLYPLPAALEGRKKALVLGLQARRPSRNGARPGGWTGPPALTCVIADVHANLPALEAVLAEAVRRGAAAFLFLGDAVGYGPHPRECIARIADLRSALVVRGNHDEAAAHRGSDLGMNRLARATAGWTWSELTEADRSWLAAMPVEHAGEGWMAVHGAPVDPRRFVAYVYDLTYEDNLACLARQGRTLCFHGHSHVQLAYADDSGLRRKLSPGEVLELEAGRTLLVNPGSVGQPRDGDARAAFALWDRTRGRITFERVTYDVDRTVRDLRAAGLPEELAARLEKGA
jgi:diadenosine tetraphosphatase ApaH/serine/threonine PP2A family protein phosphatase